jgi:hypothetical protein
VYVQVQAKSFPPKVSRQKTENQLTLREREASMDFELESKARRMSVLVTEGHLVARGSCKIFCSTENGKILEIGSLSMNNSYTPN